MPEKLTLRYPPPPPFFLPGGRRDKDGFLFVTGRVDDVMSVSGHRIGTAEIEAALTMHPAVAEAAAIQVCGHRPSRACLLRS